jgi:hypothetical protein
MTTQLFMFLAQGVAQQATGYRPGARHAFMIYVSSDDLENARPRATELASEAGWLHVEIKREKAIGSDTATISDDTLKSAAEHAIEAGGAIVVYADEIPANS